MSKNDTAQSRRRSVWEVLLGIPKQEKKRVPMAVVYDLPRTTGERKKVPIRRKK